MKTSIRLSRRAAALKVVSGDSLSGFSFREIALGAPLLPDGCYMPNALA